jgi:hypothetical protein
MDKSDGGIKLYRMILESKVFANEKMLKIWIWCLCKAAHKDHFFPLKTGKGTITIDLLKGQFVFGRFAAAKELKISGSTVWRILQKFASDEYKNMIALKTDNQYTIITICKWAEYQDGFFKGGQPTDNQRTTNGQPTDTYNNVNNVNKVNNVEAKATNFQKDEVKELAIEARTEKFRGEIFTQENAVKYGKPMLHAFFTYWSEHNRSHTKMLFELKPTWQLSGRLATWHSHETPSKKGGGYKMPPNDRIYIEK